MGYKDPAARGTKDGRRSHQPPQRPAELPRAWSKERDGTAGPDLPLPLKHKPREQGPFSRNPSQCGHSKDGQTRSKRQVSQARAVPESSARGTDGKFMRLFPPLVALPWPSFLPADNSNFVQKRR